MNNRYTQKSDMWESFNNLAIRVDDIERSQLKILSKNYFNQGTPQNLWEQSILDNLSKSTIPKKEEVTHMASTSIHLVLSAEGFAKYIQDLQEMAPDSKTKYDKNGNTIYDPETGDYVKTEIPLEERWVSVGEVKVNADGKFVVKASANTLNSMEQLNARKARIDAYQTA